MWRSKKTNNWGVGNEVFQLIMKRISMWDGLRIERALGMMDRILHYASNGDHQDHTSTN